jgi:hypothetical protein
VTAVQDADPALVANALADPRRRVEAPRFPRPEDDVDLPGLYAWFVDKAGAAVLARAAEAPLSAGLIYAGRAGAGTSSATLRSRITRNHLGGRIRSSTFRLTLASLLAAELRLAGAGGRTLASDGEERLSRWMSEHLAVAVTPVVDPAALVGLEAAVLNRLDAPLNLEGMAPTRLRARLTRLRSTLVVVGDRPVRIVIQSPAPPGLSDDPAALPRGSAPPDITSVLSALVGSTIPTMTGRPNRVLRVQGRMAWVATDRSPHGQPVDIADIQDAADRLYQTGVLTVDVATVGHRSAFVGAVLSTLPGARVLLRPRRIVLVDPEGDGK